MLITLLIFLVILSVLVLIHEAGHYFTAKKFGIKVEEFGFGFPPRLWGKKIGETIYSLNWLPIGGFVKLYGEDDAGGGRIDTSKKDEKIKDVKHAYFARPAWQRFLVVVAGIVMNAVLAVAIFYVFLFASGFKAELPAYGNHKFFGVNQTLIRVVVIDVEKQSPAEQAGITKLSNIISADGKQIETADQFSKIVKGHLGKPIVIEWQDLKTSKIRKATVIPRVNPPKNQGALGVAFSPVNAFMLNYETPMQRAFSGFSHPANLMVYNFVVLGNLLETSVKEKSAEPLSQSVSGPVGIGFAVGSIVSIPDMKERILQLLNLAGLLSASLAFFNVLPIPGLDGGRLFFIVFEMITRRKMNQKVEGYIHMVGMLLLLTLIFFVTVNDLRIHSGSIFDFFKGFLP